jgi:hypothetical protein
MRMRESEGEKARVKGWNMLMRINARLVDCCLRKSSSKGFWVSFDSADAVGTRKELKAENEIQF